MLSAIGSTPDQVARLKLIKQLLSEGWRAGAVVPLTESALQSMLGLTVKDPAPLPSEIEAAVKLLAQHRIGELQNHLSKLLAGQGMRKFLEPADSAERGRHERVVRGEMENFQELRFGDLVQRLLRDVTRLVRPQREARHVLLATPPNDPNQLGLAILELLLFTEGVNCLTLGPGVPAQEIASAAAAYKTSLVILLFDRGISGKIAGQEIRALRADLPPDFRSWSAGGRCLLAKPIADVHTAADFRSIMSMMRELGITPAPVAPSLPQPSRTRRLRCWRADLHSLRLHDGPHPCRRGGGLSVAFAFESFRHLPPVGGRAILRQLQLGVDPLHPDAKSDDRADHRTEPSRGRGRVARARPGPTRTFES